MIRASNLTKHYRKKTAVDDLSFVVADSKVTGFLGPNGAGKSTTMRLMLGLDNGSGTTTYDHKKLREYSNPSQVVGILLEAKAFHPTRSAHNHLRMLADAGNIPTKRVEEALDLVGLKTEAKKKPGKFSLGMSQRLGIAAAILGKPKYLILDEPANGLDPEGIAWLREFLKNYADDGNAVFVSSHLLSEMAQMVDNVVVIAKGKMIADTSIKELLSREASSVIVRTNNQEKLAKAIKENHLDFVKAGEALEVKSVKSDKIGQIAHDEKLIVLELSPQHASLEAAFLELTEGETEFQAKGGAK